MRRPWIVPGHDSRLVQVVNNLVDNARSFSPPGGTVRLICRRLKSEIEIVVDDDGPGIAPDALQRIFERFYTDRPHQGFGQNSGLGLSISKQIVEAHAGRMWAENRMGAGARRTGTRAGRPLRRAPAGEVEGELRRRPCMPRRCLTGNRGAAHPRSRRQRQDASRRWA